jgi:integrase/recombinase XerD
VSEIKRTPKHAAKRITRILKEYDIDHNFLRKTFEYVRQDLGVRGKSECNKRLPELLTEAEMRKLYDAIWKEAEPTHMIMIKLLLYTGIRISELINLQIDDVNLEASTIRIEQGKGGKDRYVLFPEGFKAELNQYLAVEKKEKQARKRKTDYLFETTWKNKPTDRYIRKILKDYAIKAGINKKIYPHLFFVT